MSENITSTKIKNLYTKIQTAKKMLSERNLKKSGKNSYSGFVYYELSDFMPSIIEIFNDLGLFSKITFTDETATLKIVNSENPAEQEEYSSPMKTLELKGANAVQSLGGVETYQRRYLYMSALDITESDIFDADSGKDDNKKEPKPTAQYVKESAERDKQYRISTGENGEATLTSPEVRSLLEKEKESDILEVAKEYGYNKIFAIKKKHLNEIMNKVVNKRLEKQKGA